MKFQTKLPFPMPKPMFSSAKFTDIKFAFVLLFWQSKTLFLAVGNIFLYKFVAVAAYPVLMK